MNCTTWELHHNETVTFFFSGSSVHITPLPEPPPTCVHYTQSKIQTPLQVLQGPIGPSHPCKLTSSSSPSLPPPAQASSFPPEPGPVLHLPGPFSPFKGLLKCQIPSPTSPADIPAQGLLPSKAATTHHCLRWPSSSPASAPVHASSLQVSGLELSDHRLNRAASDPQPLFSPPWMVGAPQYPQGCRHTPTSPIQLLPHFPFL